MKNQINKIVSVVILFFFLSSCHKIPKSFVEGERDRAFKNYLIMRKIEFTELSNSLYSKYYSDFLDYETKELLSKTPFLKFNQVYVYQGTNNNIRYFVFSDVGYVYTVETDRHGSEFVSEAVEGKIKVTKPFPLLFYGFYKLEDTIIKIKIREKKRYKELYMNDVGVVSKDTVRLTGYYKSIEFKYKKKWLAKTHKTNFKLVYQPDLTATFINHNFWGEVFRVEGEFKDDHFIEVKK